MAPSAVYCKDEERLQDTALLWKRENKRRVMLRPREIRRDATKRSLTRRGWGEKRKASFLGSHSITNWE